MPSSPKPASQPSPLLKVIIAESLTRSLTAFSSFEEMLTAPNYTPSLNCTDPDRARLADLYDQEQERRGDDRRAFRYGSPEIRTARLYQRLRKVRSPKKIAFSAAFALCLLASPSYAVSDHKIVLLTGISSECLLGDKCPETRTEVDEFGQLKGQPQVLPALLSLGWRIVSVVPVNADQGYSHRSVLIPSSYVLLQK